MTRKLRGRGALAVGIAMVLFCLAPAAALFRHRLGVARADAEWRDHVPAPLGDIGSTRRLEILPLVEWHAAGTGLATDMGVSYLVRTDTHTILFDTGHNSREQDPSPLEGNMAALGVSLADIDTVVLSHAHFDHVGGTRWTEGALSGTTFGIGNDQPSLVGKRVLTPVPMTYPGIVPELAAEPTRLGGGVATTGTIGRKLFGGRTDEQALAVQVEGKGIVLVVGCGHQTLTRLLARADSIFSAPLHGVVGGLHYPVPEGRLLLGGIVDAQRRFGSGTGPLDPLTSQDIDSDFQLLESRAVGLVSIGGHDSSDEVIAKARDRFGTAWRDLRVGEAIVVEGVL